MVDSLFRTARAQALARLHLSPHVTEPDINEAIRLVHTYVVARGIWSTRSCGTHRRRTGMADFPTHTPDRHLLLRNVCSRSLSLTSFLLSLTASSVRASSLQVQGSACGGGRAAGKSRRPRVGSCRVVSCRVRAGFVWSECVCSVCVCAYRSPCVGGSGLDH